MMTSLHSGKAGLTGIAGMSLALMGLMGVPSAHGATVTLSVTDSIGETSMDQDGSNHWSDGLDPSVGNDYVVDVEWLRTPGSGDVVFAGDSLTLQSNGGIITKNGGAQTVTTNLILDGGLVRSGAGSGDTFTLAGTVDITANNGALVPDQSPYIISADITGTGDLYLLNDASQYGFSSTASGSGQGIDLTAAGTMTGNVIADASDMVWTDTSSWTFNIGASGVNNTIAGAGDATFDGTFLFDLTGASSTPGDSWTITNVTTQTYGATFNIATAGFSQSGSVWTDGTYTFNPATGILAVGLPPVEWAVDGDGAWDTGANWTGGSAPATDGDALLGSIITADHTVTLDSNIQLNSLTLSNAGDGDYYIVPAAAQTLTLTGEAKIDVAGRHWMREQIAGTSGLNATGSGELVLDAANSFSGGLNIDGTNVAVVNTDALPAGTDITAINGGSVRFWGANNGFFTDHGSAGYGTGTVAGNVSLDATSAVQVNDGADVTFTGVISGDGSVSVSSANADFSTAHTYAGTTTLAGDGTLTLSGAGTLGAADGTAATQTNINDTAQLVLDNVSLGDENLVLGERADGSAAHVLSTGANTIAGNIYADIPGDGGHYILESTSGTLTLGGTISAYDAAEPNDRTYVFQGAGDFDVTGRITDMEVDADGEVITPAASAGANVHVVKRGAGTLTIDTGSATLADYWQGSTVVEQGTLAVTAAGSNEGELRSAVIDVQAGATLDVSSFTEYNLQTVDVGPDATQYTADDIGQTVSGAGTIDTGSGTFFAYEDAVLAPGDSGAGTLTFDGNLAYEVFTDDLNGTMNFDLSGSAAGSNDLIDVTGNLTMSASGGVFRVNIAPVNNTLQSGTPYTLMQGGTVSGTASAGNFSGQIVKADGSPMTTRLTPSFAVNSGASGNVQVTFSGSAANQTWTGAGDTNWDVNSTANWSGTGSTYYDLDSVAFAGAGSGSVVVAENVNPNAVVVSNAAYDFSGSDINAASVTVNNGGTASFSNNVSGNVTVASTGTLAGTGTFSNDVTVQSGGTLQVGGATMPQVTQLVFQSIDNFDTPGLSEYNFSKVLDQGTATNVSFSDAAGTIDVTSTGADGAEQVLLLRSDVTLGQGEELQLDAPATFNDRDFGLAIGQTHADLGDGVTGDNRNSADYLFMAWRDFGQLNSRGVNANTEVALQQAFGTTPDKLFIARTATDDIELGWYDGQTRNVLWTATPTTLDIFSNVGFYADVRADGNGFAGADNFGKLVDGGLLPAGETMTVQGDLILDAGATVSFDIATSGINDLLNLTGALTAGGTLDVALDASVSALAEGDTYDLFDFASASGTFATINLPTLDSGLEWDLSNLYVTGEISVATVSAIPGDLNGDGYVGLDDLQPILDHWNQNVTVGDPMMGDISGPGGVPDGYVGLDDLQPVFDHWNEGVPPTPSSIPEPASLVLLSLGGLALMRRR